MDLPITEQLPAIRGALKAHTEAVVQAPTGAGKTTGIPPALLEASWLEGRRIIMLEPRRLAARAAARRMAAVRGERAGETIGYRVRMDTQVSDRTRIEVVTEGVLTRMCQSDPMLEGTGLVIFDEYHERSVQADLALALCLDIQRSVRSDLRLLVMSATLDGAAVASLLGNAPVLTSEGRLHPVDVKYQKRSSNERIEAQTAAAVRQALQEKPAPAGGDVLVFLPGAGEIRRTQQRLEEGGLPEHVDVLPLFGNLPQKAQDKAIAPSRKGRRKVVLSTDIAETSLTIEGITIVIDGGRMRVPRFSPASGMTRLATIRVSKSSADQRKGRAGRLAPGTCYRLWTRHTQHHLEPQTDPEILHADLAPLALELARWGVASPDELRWLDAPPEAAYSQACDLLERLEVLDADRRITSHGREVAELGMHPRLAHMVLRARERGRGALGCDLAALLSERDIIQGRGGPPEADLRLRLEALQQAREGRRPRAAGQHPVHQGALAGVQRVSEHWRRRLGITSSQSRGTTDAYDMDGCGMLAALAYPDRIAYRLGAVGGQETTAAEARFRLENGRPAVLTHPQVLSDADYLVAANLQRTRGETRIFLAAPVTREDLAGLFSERIAHRDRLRWDADRQHVRARRQETLGAVILKDGPLADPDPEQLADTLLGGIAESGLKLLPWTKGARQLQERLIFLHQHSEDASHEWPDVSDEGLLDRMDEWLKPYVYGMKRADELQQLNLANIFREQLDWDQRSVLNDFAPTHLTVPSGSRRPIDYSDPEQPVLAVRLQEMFGATKTPRIAGGRVPVTLHLLSPAQRPVQITQDLAGFWADTYFDVKKDMKGRYPKHYWPDDPLTATPTNRVRPKK